VDQPYIETLPSRIAKACIQAHENLQVAELSHAEVPCEGVSLNREYDVDSPPLQDVLRPDWRPAKPELTDTTCHVLVARAEGKVIGFASSFGCHPVVCCRTNRYIHGDFCGVATNLLEREHPGSVGLFLQGALGDVNSCVVHKSEQEALLALDVIAGRYAGAVREGIRSARPLPALPLVFASQQATFTRVPWGEEEIRAIIEEKESLVHHPDATDSMTMEGRNLAMETVHLVALRRLLGQLERGESLTPSREVQGIRLGEITLLGSGFEIFQAIKNDVKMNASGPITLVLSTTNEANGYAPDHTRAEEGYAAKTVPMMCGELPYAGIHGELVESLLAVDERLHATV
jgi:hypothetical protein